MKVEIGCGARPTPGYFHTDITPQPGVELDYRGPAWSVPVACGTADEVLALGCIEHLSQTDAIATFVNVHRMLKPGGVFLFDVPDLVAWCNYLVELELGHPVPFEREHILATLYGWQRWPGDEHRYGWTDHALLAALEEAGFSTVTWGLEPFLARGIVRRRFGRIEDAHIYTQAAA